MVAGKKRQPAVQRPLVVHDEQVSEGKLFAACEVGGHPAGLKGELVKWARAHWRRIGAPVRKPEGFRTGNP